MNYKSVYKLKHILLTIYSQLCHNVLTVIQYYIIIKIKKTKTSRKDLKKGKNMINQKKDFNMITKKLETELSSFHFEGLEISEITPKTSWMKLHINVLFIKGNEQITKVLYKDYETGLWYYIKNDGMIISHKDTFNHTIKNLIDEMIYDCHIEIEEAEETEATEETEETEKDVIEVVKIEDINYCPNQNTCCVVSPFVHCNYNYKSDACNKAHKNFIDYCEQIHKQMQARSNPEWHHVSLATLANIDIDMLDETRQIYMHVRYQLNRVIKAIYKCNHYTAMDILRTSIIQQIENLLRNKKVTRSLLRYAEAQIDNCYLVNGVISSKYAGSYSEKSSRAYKKYFCL